MSIRHVIREGECVSSVAYDHGFFPDTVWDHPENEALKRDRNPHVLQPGDVLHIPERRKREENCEAGQIYRFKRKGVPEKFRARLCLDGQPRVRARYELILEEQRYQGETDADGRLEHWMPPDARRGKLIVHGGGAPEIYELALGQLDPPASDRGLRARLLNLGFFRDSDGDDALPAALRRFQATHGLRASGELDDKTRDALGKAYGI